MAIEILMPALSPTMEEGTLAKWLVAEGAEVRSGDVIAEIETDKATMEVEALDDGTIGKILIAAGTEGVKVNSLIAVLLEEGESADAVSNGRAGGSTCRRGSGSCCNAICAGRSGGGRDRCRRACDQRRCCRTHGAGSAA